MLREALLFLTLVAAVSALKCAYSVSSNAELSVTGGVDNCQNNDEYCLTIINYSSSKIYAKGCSKTSEKITDVSRKMPSSDEIQCKEFLKDGGGCNDENSICCCTGDMCNSSTGMAIVTSFAVFAMARMFI